MQPDRTERRLAAIMFTDIVGYTALMAASEQRGLSARARHRALVQPLVRSHRGESIEAKGDESLSVFPNVLDAVRCALEIEDRLREEPDLRLHIGIHLGDVVVRDGEVSGDGVNIASRICALSPEGGIRVSGEVHRSIRNQPDVESLPLGEHALKNVGQPVAVFAVGRPGTLAAVRRSARWGAVARRAPLWAGALVVVAAAAGWWMLRGPVAEDAGPIRSIAVLPLENLSGDPEQEHFADGMTETLIGDLGKIGALKVISRTSVMRYKGAKKPLPEIAAELGVDALLEGTVMRDGERVRVTAQLIDGRTDHHLWAERYDRELRGILELQSDVARAVARQIELELSPREVALLANRPPVDPAAHDALLKGYYLLGRASLESVRSALASFERAIELDPSYAAAHASLGFTWRMLAIDYFAVPQLEARPKARSATLRALELDDGLAEAHFARALVALQLEWDWPASERHCRRALELNPSLASAHVGYALDLATRGRHDEAIASAQRGVQLAPTLSRIEALRVLARTSAFAMRGKDIGTVGAELRVGSVVEGSVRRSDDQLRVTAQLIRVSDGSHLWSARYDRKLADVFAIQSEIARAIAEAIRGELGIEYDQSFLSSHEPSDVRAYELMKKGYAAHYPLFTEEGLRKAIEYYEQALARSRLRDGARGHGLRLRAALADPWRSEDRIPDGEGPSGTGACP